MRIWFQISNSKIFKNKIKKRETNKKKDILFSRKNIQSNKFITINNKYFIIIIKIKNQPIKLNNYFIL